MFLEPTNRFVMKILLKISYFLLGYLQNNLTVFKNYYLVQKNVFSSSEIKLKLSLMSNLYKVNYL